MVLAAVCDYADFDGRQVRIEPCKVEGIPAGEWHRNGRLTIGTRPLGWPHCEKRRQGIHSAAAQAASDVCRICSRTTTDAQPVIFADVPNQIDRAVHLHLEINRFMHVAETMAQRPNHDLTSLCNHR